MSLPQDKENLVYNFNFDKLGLEPAEYERCLASKVDSLVQGQSEEIKKLAKESIIIVEREVRVRQIDGKKDSRMDKRFKATQLYIDEGYLKDYNDTFWKHNNRSGGSQGSDKKSKQWANKYHENEYKLWEIKLLNSICPAVDRLGVPTVRFCNAIDKVTAHLIRNLSEGKQLNCIEVKEVFELCGRLVRGRTAVDWAIENNLFVDRRDDWKKHVLVIMSYAALMVVANMIHRKLVGKPCVERRAQNPFTKWILCPSFDTWKIVLRLLVSFFRNICGFICVRRWFFA